MSAQLQIQFEKRPQLERIRLLMADGRFRTYAQIKDAIGGDISETGVSARLRELRSKGYMVTLRRVAGYRNLFECQVTTVFTFPSCEKDYAIESNRDGLCPQCRFNERHDTYGDPE